MNQKHTGVDYERNRQVRQQLLSYTEKYGTTYTFIARKVNLSRAMISKWLKEERSLSQANLAAVENLLGELTNTNYETTKV